MSAEKSVQASLPVVLLLVRSTPVRPALWPLSPALMLLSAGCVAGHSRHPWFLLDLLELDRKSIVFHLQTIALIVFFPFPLNHSGWVLSVRDLWKRSLYFGTDSLYFGISLYILELTVLTGFNRLMSLPTFSKVAGRWFLDDFKTPSIRISVLHYKTEPRSTTVESKVV